MSCHGYLKIWITLCFLWLCSAVGEEDVKFRTRTYKASSTLDSSAYQSPSYVSQRVRTTEKAPQNTRSQGFWQRFISRRSKESDVPLEAEPSVKTTPLKQGPPIRVPTIQTPAGLIPEKQPFVAADKKCEDKIFQDKKTSEEKNPLLTPRQGIKELN